MEIGNTIFNIPVLSAVLAVYMTILLLHCVIYIISLYRIFITNRNSDLQCRHTACSATILVAVLVNCIYCLIRNEVNYINEYISITCIFTIMHLILINLFDNIYSARLSARSKQLLVIVNYAAYITAICMLATAKIPDHSILYAATSSNASDIANMLIYSVVIRVDNCYLEIVAWSEFSFISLIELNIFLHMSDISLNKKVLYNIIFVSFLSCYSYLQLASYMVQSTMSRICNVIILLSLLTSLFIYVAYKRCQLPKLYNTRSLLYQNYKQYIKTAELNYDRYSNTFNSVGVVAIRMIAAGIIKERLTSAELYTLLKNGHSKPAFKAALLRAVHNITGSEEMRTAISYS